ncbi:MAG: SdrD B-like domain-containing protein [Dehalococcoidia bacterium]
MHKRLVLVGICVAVALTAVALKGVSPAVGAGGGTISGRLINDVDGDGNPDDAAEPGLAGWRVELAEGADQGTPQTVETKTDRNGEYHFDDLPPGLYALSIPCDQQPHLWIATWPAAQTFSAVTLDAGADSEPVNFLLKLVDQAPPANGSINGRLTWDQNRNAQADPNEGGAGGWTVRVSFPDAPQCFPVEDQVVSTLSDGSFRVPGLMAGTYLATISPPAGAVMPYVLDYPGTSDHAAGWGGWDIYNYNAEVEVPGGGIVNLVVGIVDLAGTGSVSGQLYWDKNQDGTRGADEPVVACDCAVELMVNTPHGFAAISGDLTASIGNGSYTYSGLAAGEYRVFVWPRTVPEAGGDSMKDVTLSADQSLNNVDFGLWFTSDQATPTVVPGSGPPTPVPTSASAHITSPNTGSGPQPATSSTFAAAFALAFVGAGAVTLTIVVRRRRRS